MCPERVRDMMRALSLFPPCPDPQAPIHSTDLTALWSNLERSTSPHHHSACSHFGLPQWSTKQSHALPSGQTPLWTVLPKLGSGCGFQDTQWLPWASRGLSEGSCCILEPSGQWLLLQDPGGMNRRPSASLLSCWGESCFFSCRSFEHDTAEVPISLSALINFQFLSQLLAHVDRKVLVAATNSTVGLWQLISPTASSLQGSCLWPSTPVSTPTLFPGGTHKPCKLQIIGFYIW